MITLFPNSILNIFLVGRVRPIFGKFEFCLATFEPRPEKTLLIKKRALVKGKIFDTEYGNTVKIRMKIKILSRNVAVSYGYFYSWYFAISGSKHQGYCKLNKLLPRFIDLLFEALWLCTKVWNKFFIPMWQDTTLSLYFNTRPQLKVCYYRNILYFDILYLIFCILYFVFDSFDIWFDSNLLLHSTHQVTKNKTNIDDFLGCKSVTTQGQDFARRFLHLGFRRKPTNERRHKEIAVNKHNVEVGLRQLNDGDEIACRCVSYIVREPVGATMHPLPGSNLWIFSIYTI